MFEESVLFEAEAWSFPRSLGETRVPNMFKHVEFSAFETLWAVVQPFFRAGGTRAAYLELLARMGRANPEIQAGTQAYAAYAGAAEGVIARYLGGRQARMEAMVRRAVEQTPGLWER